jgi:hypothetical protein
MKLTKGIMAAIVAAGIYIVIASLYRHEFNWQVAKEGAILGVITLLICLVIGYAVSKKKQR